jgi:thioredoxin-like negative regulator of GroEL
MAFVTAQLVMQVAILSTAVAHTDTYRDAYEQAQTRQQPLLILVGDDSCSECREMKVGRLPALKQDGSLSEIAYATVDRDKHPKLAGLLMQGEAVPQLVLYTRVGDQWRRSQINGASSTDVVRQFIEREVSHAKNLETSAAQQMQWRSSTFSS